MVAEPELAHFLWYCSSLAKLRSDLDAGITPAAKLTARPVLVDLEPELFRGSGYLASCYCALTRLQSLALHSRHPLMLFLNVAASHTTVTHAPSRTAVCC